MLIGLAKLGTGFHEALNNLQRMILLIFMVAEIYFMQNLLFVSGEVLLDGRLKTNLHILFAGMGAFLAVF